MSEAWLITMKPAFLNQMLALPAKEMAQVQKKLSLLVEDPSPDAKVKKKLKYMDGDLHRLRSGDYRVFYTYRKPFVSVLSLVRRDDDTYDDTVPPEFLGGLDPKVGPEKTAQAWDRWISKPVSTTETSLKAKITKELLENLRVPQAYFKTLLPLVSEEALFEAENVPDEVRLRVYDALVEKPLDEVMRQPDLVANDIDDLLRFKQGELLGFLLRLNPEQEKYVSWAKSAKGPTLLKGGPGTGKSTVALYRVRTMIEVLKTSGVTKPRLLFTTYTKALVEFSRQLLESLLGDDARFVEVRTADSLVRKISSSALPTGTELASGALLKQLLRESVESVEFTGNVLEQRAQTQTLKKLGFDYLLEEITGVIQARGLADLEAYAAAARPGRLQGLNRLQRRAVWACHERLGTLLGQRKRVTWPMLRAVAAQVVAAGNGPAPYDGVIVDEVQDLDPCAISMLVGLVENTGRLYLTADANQSIYGGGFRWKDIHKDLKFVGRTGVLKANHRSTKELGQAAQAYLSHGVIDEDNEGTYVHSGPTPAVRAVKNEADQSALLARFLPAAAKEFRLGLAACAVLVPDKDTGQELAEDLRARGLKATFMNSHDLDLTQPGIKVLPLQAAKGLEFPVVALAGFLDGQYPYTKAKDSQEMQQEAQRRARRTVYVAMTRAMRALLVIVPEGTEAALFSGFGPPLWNMGSPA